ncbi:hypothetical protein GCM10008904_31300 [Paraclostridium ghonii]|uniref:YtxH domain-containing protein n=1 Tax=Paraclostridium ghonii TaxID=29358 RepID=A0ABU0MX33_9FIRM|nr:hypothetical protein [Paeniclostridium ghonii]MDQ0555466.1 hypothetical protein [Paeniclostridium ghonii]
MLGKKTYKHIKEEQKAKRNKTVKLTTLTALGIGAATIGATVAYKKAKAKQEEYDYDNYNLDSFKDENNDYELQSKVEEFNSNRLSYDNEEHSSTEEMNKFLNKIDSEDEDLNKD